MLDITPQIVDAIENNKVIQHEIRAMSKTSDPAHAVAVPAKITTRAIIMLPTPATTDSFTISLASSRPSIILSFFFLIRPHYDYD